MSAQNATGADHPPRFLRFREVQSRVGMSRSAIYRDIAAGTFPKSVRVGPQTVAWIESEITAWMQARIASSRGGA